ncbi:MAG: putative quinol monooxygenase [Pseudonocardia sp.]
MIFIVVKFTIRPEYSDEWLSRTEDYTNACRAEAGNVFFEWSRSVDNPHQFVLVEGFESAEAGAAHVATDHFKAAMEWMPDVVAEKPQIIHADIPQDGWGEMGEITPR